MAKTATSDGDHRRAVHVLRLCVGLHAAAPAPLRRGPSPRPAPPGARPLRRRQARPVPARRVRVRLAAPGSSPFDDLLLSVPDASDLPRSASLASASCLVLQRFKAVVADCAARSRTLLLPRSDETGAELWDLHHDLATLLDLLPVVELGLADDVADLLASRRRRRSAAAAAAGPPALNAVVLALIDEIEREIVPGRERLEGILEEVGVKDPASCGEEIEALEREIGDRTSESWTPAMIALVGLHCEEYYS
ncbi:hypothetical protein QYE76_028944 [Lolium multiflorum]|uniref:Uncharacterized protein n=1 Tax=Lolium multiflorum TaxID=4521 RepID=A0AAD8VHE9_LOLMU|nr:hypothetical protein QYE76_028944 [Lolium multiflorum]